MRQKADDQWVLSDGQMFSAEMNSDWLLAAIIKVIFSPKILQGVRMRESPLVISGLSAQNFKIS